MGITRYIHTFVLSYFTYFSRIYILSLLTRLTHGRLNLTLKDKPNTPPERLVFGVSKEHDSDAPEVSLVVRSSNVWTRLCMNLDLGFAESYLYNELDLAPGDLVSIVQIYIQNWDVLGSGSFILSLLPRLQRFLFVYLRPNNKGNAEANARSHYDTSNALFQAFLSKDLCYSCPIWEGEEESLEDAQLRKVRNVIDKAEIMPGMEVLDIGGGWGFLAIEAVRRTGCKMTVTTLSREQKALGEQKIKEAGLEGSIRVLLCDYRDTPLPGAGKEGKGKKYDRIVSVEMLEHVGKEYMDGFFQCISGLLDPVEGICVVQGITIINKIHDAPKLLDNFLDRYIFPGGYLPSIHRLASAINIGSSTTLEVSTVQSIGPHYVKALRLWREKFMQNWEEIKRDYVSSKKEIGDVVGEDEIEAWKRRWIYYFSYCEAGFRAGVLGDHVVVARRRPNSSEGASVPF